MDTLPSEETYESLNERGSATLPSLIDPTTCDELISLYTKEIIYQKTVIMERDRFGLGEYKYFNYPLPAFIHELRTSMYAQPAPIANQWMRILNLDIEYPKDHTMFLTACHQEGQQKPTPLIPKYGKGGYNTLHQDLYGGPHYFPLQLVLFLSDYGTEGGEFIITEQVPRSQSKAQVIKSQKGDALLLASSFRPVKGARGYYCANLRHGVSEVTAGSRYTMGIIFHDAIN